MSCVEERRIPLIAILTVTNLFGNSMIIWIYIKKSSLQINCHALLVNLSASDLLMAATLLPLGIAAHFSSPHSCSSIQLATEFIGYTAFASTIVNIMFSNIDRYIACCHGFLYESIESKLTVIAIITSWVIPALVSGLCLLETPAPRETAFIRARTSTDVFYLTATVSGMIVIIFCQVKLYRKSKACMNAIAQQTTSFHGQESVSLELQRHQKKVLSVVTAITISFCFCYLPMTAAKIGLLLGHPSNALVNFEKAAACLAVVNGTINPAVYGLSSSSMRQAIIQEIRKLLRWLCRRTQNTVGPTVAQTNIHMVETKDH